MLPNRLFFDSKFWFIMHFPVMLGVTILCLMAFLLAMIARGWTLFSLNFNSYFFLHEFFGITCMCLNLIQVIYKYLFRLIFNLALKKMKSFKAIAILRPEKDSKWRPYFNWFHRITGLLSYILASI